jgi:hypothetical protein
MLSPNSEKALSSIIAAGACFTAIFLLGGSVTDPVNATKLTSLGVTSFLALGVLLACGIRFVVKISPILWVLSTLYLLLIVASVVFSDSPLSQGVYGSYGRNNGLITYLFLVVLLVATTSLSRMKSLNKILVAFFIAGLINVIYCLWVIVFGDFVGWNNPYGNILGTFGNPNFIGSFLGMFIAAYLGYGLGKSTNVWFKYSMLIVIPVTAYEIYDSSAIQGRVLGVFGTGLVLFFVIRSKVKPIFTLAYTFFCAVMAGLSALGALQIGPFTEYIYKNSVSLRGQYWLAGWNTGADNPFNGVGMDALGDWYRRSRDLRAIELPGVDTVVNAAHNVPLDMFAFGGWPLFLTYIAMMALGGFSLVKAILRRRDYDPILVALTVAWSGYQLQSIISINQIGLAIWGWILTGAAVAYERMTRNDADRAVQLGDKKVRTINGNQEVLIVPSSIGFGLIGLLIAIPPLTADHGWRQAQINQSVTSLESSMVSSYFNPPNTMKFVVNIQLLERSSFAELAHKYALQAVQWNPESYDLWKTLYLIKNSSLEEKSTALENMKRLDPLNPEISLL